MISFAFTARDEEILEEARAQARLAMRYARDFERDEDRLLPPVYPEAEGRPDPRALLQAHLAETSGAKIINALLYLEDWRGGVPLREARYSLGNTVLQIAGSVEQQARWADKTIAIALTEPIGGSDPAATRTTATWDAAREEWLIEGEKIFITYAQSCDAALVLAPLVHPERRGLSTFMVEKGTPGFTFGRQYRKMGIRFEDTAGLVFSGCRVPVFNHIDGDLKKTLRSFSEIAAGRGCLRLGRYPRSDGFHLGAGSPTSAGVTPDYDARVDRDSSAAADRMLALEAEWEATYVTVSAREMDRAESEGPGKIESSVAKTMGGTLARKVTQTCVALIGAAALSEALPLEKAFRDARISDIYEGAGEIQRLIIAREILYLSPKELNWIHAGAGRKSAPRRRATRTLDFSRIRILTKVVRMRINMAAGRNVVLSPASSGGRECVGNDLTRRVPRVVWWADLMALADVLTFAQFANALALASLLTLLATGLALVFGLRDVMNFAHGALFMLGAYLGYSVSAAAGFLGGACHCAHPARPRRRRIRICRDPPSKRALADRCRAADLRLGADRQPTRHQDLGRLAARLSAPQPSLSGLD